MFKALYLKWRPTVFSDVVGQEHITTTLKNEVMSGKIAHAYLFTGTRGTGKTTCARILAKAVNCLDPVNGEPCNKCSSCREIDSGSSVDIIEIDGASNNKVEHAHEILSEVVYTPVSAKKKVYIIDEVHMLTTQAFNALLKTLEEPPEHVMFIFATTEPQKVIPTILSRCQRFDFHRISKDVIRYQLEKIASSERVDFETGSLSLIARQADGSMRDAISFLDLCISSIEKLTIEGVTNTLGLIGREHIYALSREIARHDAAKALTKFSEIYDIGKSVTLLTQDMIEYFRNLLILKASPGAASLIENTGDTLNDLKEGLGSYNISGILYMIDILGETLNRLTRTTNERIEFETCLFKLCDPKMSRSFDSILFRLDELEKRSGQKTPPPRSPAPAEIGVKTEPAQETVPPPPEKDEKAEKADGNVSDTEHKMIGEKAENGLFTQWSGSAEKA